MPGAASGLEPFDPAGRQNPGSAVGWHPHSGIATLTYLWEGSVRYEDTTAAVTGAVVLFPRYGIVGIAGAIALSGWVGATLIAVTLLRRGWLRLEGAALHRLPRLLLATAIMGSLIAGGDALAASWLDMAGSQLARIASLGLLVVFGLGVYLLALQAFGVTSPRILLKAWRERL